MTAAGGHAFRGYGDDEDGYSPTPSTCTNYPATLLSRYLGSTL